jgi:serine/threonine-protein kinase PknG
MEYVAGRTLKAIRRSRGPLPPAEAMAYILGILPAFAYLHEQNLVYCDFKPDNVMLEGDDVKLIDMGAVRRIGDPGGDIYGTVGFKAPEADHDPGVASDLFTVGRTLAVLLMDLDNTGRYVTALPPPDELLYTVPEDSLRANATDAAARPAATLASGLPLPPWLRFNPSNRSFSGTAPPGVVSTDVRVNGMPITLTLPLAAADPDARFGSADEMAAQLGGVLRETVARETPVPAIDSAVFSAEPAVPGDPFSLDGAWRRLPAPRLDPADPAAPDLFAAFAAAPASRDAMLVSAAKRWPTSAEIRLRLAGALIDTATAEVDAVMRHLDAALAFDPFDWRPDWYCGRLYLSLGRPAEAVECFDKVYSELPGELAPKLGLAMALEADGRGREAAGLYDTVSRTDPTLASASFGLARCLMAADDRRGAVAALARVPDSAALASEARLAAIRLLISGDPGDAELRQASDILTVLERRDIARQETEAAVALLAARRAEAGGLQGAAMLGVPLTGKALRRRAEDALRACARMSDSVAERIFYIDQANAVRPRTLI